MKLLRARFFLAAALVCGASSTHADGFYMGVGGFARHYDLSQTGAVQSMTPSGYSLSGKLFAGYDFDDTWSFETGYVGFGKPTYDYTLNGSTAALSTAGRAWFGAAKASMSLNEQFSLFGKIGLDRHRFEVSGSGAAAALATNKTTTALYLSFGTQYNFSKNVAATLEFEHFGTDSRPGSPLNGVSFNLKYSF